QKLQRTAVQTPLLEGWVGHLGYGALLIGRLHEVHLDEQGKLVHFARSALEARTKLLHVMSTAPSLDEKALETYLLFSVDEEAIREVIMPLVRAYLRDPEFLQRYNYGRGRSGQFLDDADKGRVEQAHAWVSKY